MRWILSLALAATLTAQQISYHTIPRERLEQMLESLEKTNAKRSARLAELFRESGCEPELQKVKSSKLPNVVCTIAGETDDVVVIGAHYDKVREGEGAVDNWTGVALLAALAKSVQNKQRRLTFRFVGFTDEEVGLVGSKAYVKQFPKKQPVPVKLMINIDSVGMGRTNVWHSRSDKALVGKAVAIADALKIPLGLVNVENVGDSDSHSFAERKVPVIDFHSLTSETLPVLHSPRDRLEAVNRDAYFDAYRLLAAFLAWVDLPPAN